MYMYMALTDLALSEDSITNGLWRVHHTIQDYDISQRAEERMQYRNDCGEVVVENNDVGALLGDLRNNRFVDTILLLIQITLTSVPAMPIDKPMSACHVDETRLSCHVTRIRPFIS